MFCDVVQFYWDAVHYIHLKYTNKQLTVVNCRMNIFTIIVNNNDDRIKLLFYADEWFEAFLFETCVSNQNEKYSKPQIHYRNNIKQQFFMKYCQLETGIYFHRTIYAFLILLFSSLNCNYSKCWCIV